MIHALEGPGSLKTKDVGGLLDDADDSGIAFLIGAEQAGLILFDEEATVVAGTDGIMQERQCLR